MHPNEQLVRSLYASQARGDIDAYLGMLTDDVVFHIPGRSVVAGTFIGRDEVRRHFREVAELSRGTFRTAVHDVLANDEHCVALIGATAEREGVSVELPRVHVWHARDGLLAELWLYPLDQADFDDFWGRGTAST